MLVLKVVRLDQDLDGLALEQLFWCLSGDPDENLGSLSCQISILHVLLKHIANGGDQTLADHLTNCVWEDVHQKEEALQNGD